MNEELRQALYTFLTAMSSLTGGIYYLRATQNNDNPYLVFSEYSEEVSKDSTTTFIEVYVQFTIRTTDIASLETFVELFHNRMSLAKSTISLASYYLIDVQRLSTRPIGEQGKLFNKICQYKFSLQKK